MPKLVNYADRFDGIREAVYVVTLRDGVEGITLAAVADWLQMSPRTIQRLMGSAEALPRLGLQWAEMCERLRLTGEYSPGRRSASAAAERALAGILASLPGRAGAEDRDVWWTLVLAHEATCDWAREGRRRHEEMLATLSVEAVAGVPEQARTVEARRLHVLTSGAIAQICAGICSPDEARSLISDHVRGLIGDLRTTAGDAA